jgi:hypothetical protein
MFEKIIYHTNYDILIYNGFGTLLIYFGLTFFNYAYQFVFKG